jgi:hypothetical protein
MKHSALSPALNPGVAPRLRLTHRLRKRYVSCAWYPFQSSGQPIPGVEFLCHRELGKMSHEETVGVEIQCHRELEKMSQTAEMGFQYLRRPGKIGDLDFQSTSVAGIVWRLRSWCSSGLFSTRLIIACILEGLDGRMCYRQHCLLVFA